MGQLPKFNTENEDLSLKPDKCYASKSAVPHFGCQSKNLLLLPGFSNAPPGIKKKLGGCKMTNSKWTKCLLVAWPSGLLSHWNFVTTVSLSYQGWNAAIQMAKYKQQLFPHYNFPIQIENHDCLSLSWCFDNYILEKWNTKWMTTYGYPQHIPNLLSFWGSKSDRN